MFNYVLNKKSRLKTSYSDWLSSLKSIYFTLKNISLQYSCNMVIQ